MISNTDLAIYDWRCKKCGVIWVGNKNNNCPHCNINIGRYDRKTAEYKNADCLCENTRSDGSLMPDHGVKYHCKNCRKEFWVSSHEERFICPRCKAHCHHNHTPIVDLMNADEWLKQKELGVD